MIRDTRQQRPRLEVPRTWPDFVAEVLALAGVVSGALLLAIIWTELPGEIPRHFGITGEPTAWSGRWSAVVPVVIAIAFYAGFTVLTRYPHIFNYPWPITPENAAIQYRLVRSMVIWLKAILVLMLVAIVWSQVRVAVGDADTVNPFMIFGFLVSLHVVMGIFLYRAYVTQDGDASRDPFN
jgi:hypothetical protein